MKFFILQPSATVLNSGYLVLWQPSATVLILIVLDIFMARTIQKDLEFASQAEVPFFPSSTYQEEKQV